MDVSLTPYEQEMVDAQLRVIAEVRAERLRQEIKWGPQNHTPMEWIPILMEEVGEASQRAAQAYFGGEHNGNGDERLRQYREEMVQVAALAVAMVESFDRNEAVA